MIARFVGVAASVLTLALAGRASAEQCATGAVEWVSRCAKTSGVPLMLIACPPGVAVVEAATTPRLRIEISRGRPAFRQSGTYGLSPIGSFDDWAAQPEPMRRALDGVAECVERESPAELFGAAPPQTKPADDNARRSARPWLLLASVVIAGLALFASRRPRAPRHAAPIAAGAFALSLAILALTAPFAFFHQNGQGPFWIELALLGDGVHYGPGYPELFNTIAVAASRPDRAIAIAQLLLAATIPLSAYAISRAAGAARVVAALLGVALVIDPVIVRTARSESYFATIVGLLFAASAVLSSAARRPRVPFALATIAAGLLVAQAARVHPLAWVPSACVPLVLACARAPLRTRVIRTAVAAAVIGAVALPFVVPTMRLALSSELGGGFFQGARVRAAHFGVRALVVIALSTLCLVLPRLRRIGLSLMSAALACALAVVTNVVELDAPVVSAAYLHLFAPAVVAALASLSTAWRRPWVPAVGVAALALTLWVRARPIVVLPTDARELAWWLELREQLPSDAVVASIERVEMRVLMLPLAGRGLPRAAQIDPQRGEASGPAPTLYYRSSLCVTPEGAPACARFESSHRLRLLHRRSLPSRPSLPWLALPPGEIEVALFVIE